MVVAWLAVPRAAQAQSGLSVLDYLPNDTAMVASVDVARLHRTPWWRLLRTRLGKKAGLADAMAELESSSGIFDARRTDRIWLAAPVGGLEPDQMVALIKGRLRAADIDRWAARRSGSAPMTHTVGTHRYASSGDIAWAWLPGGLLVISHADRMPAVLAAAAKRGSGARRNALLRAAVREASRGRAHAWIALRVPKRVRAELARQPLMSNLAKMRWLAARVVMGKHLRVVGRLDAGDADAARLIAGMLTQMIEAKKAAASSGGAALSATTAVARGAQVLIDGRIDAAAGKALLAR